MQFVKKCDGGCGRPASIYAMGPNSGDWGGFYCLNCKPSGFIITDYL
jgi:hypothetical protein